jgi:hypothetical protein
VAPTEIRNHMETSDYIDRTLGSESPGQSKQLCSNDEKKGWLPIPTTPTSCRQFQDFITTIIDGVEYRVTLDHEEIDIQFSKLTGLLISTARELFEATGKKTFEVISLSGEVTGMRFEVW